jgi:hypothetical protein
VLERGPVIERSRLDHPFPAPAAPVILCVFPWKEPEELKQRTIDRVRRFLQAHIPMRAAAQ